MRLQSEVEHHLASPWHAPRLSDLWAVVSNAIQVVGQSDAHAQTQVVSMATLHRNRLWSGHDTTAISLLCRQSSLVPAAL
eukprot:4834605-Amphidinium_carterae.1